MHRRLLVAASFFAVFSLLGLHAGPARAQEIRVTTPMTWVTPDGSPELRHHLALARMHAETAVPFELDPPMKDVRLSRGAKTAIIVGAIVVGVLLIVGVVVLAKPGKKVP